MTNKKTIEIVAEIVEALTPLDSAERVRVIQASLTLLGETFPTGQSRNSDHGIGDEDDGRPALPARAQTWMRQNDVSPDELQQVFHLENGTAEVIAGEIPGKSKKDKAYAAYLLTGLSKLLSTGYPTFDDKSARALCESSGCYDQANHSVYIKDRGNEFTGTKEKGWTLTAPGLKRAAAIVKEIAKG
jgi:hypothetical protein